MLSRHSPGHDQRVWRVSQAAVRSILVLVDSQDGLLQRVGLEALRQAPWRLWVCFPAIHTNSQVDLYEMCTKASFAGVDLVTQRSGGVMSMELRSSQQRLTAASADGLCRRREVGSSHGDTASMEKCRRFVDARRCELWQ